MRRLKSFGEVASVIYEKSCGFVVYQEQQGLRTYLIIRASSGEYGFPKGHVEGSETEYETALRELKEETNLQVQIIDGFRRQIEYPFPGRPNVIKQAVYFLGRCTSGNIVCQETEVAEARFVPMETALALLSFESTRQILQEADAHLNSPAPA